jgi:hypothetical protein
MEESRPPVIDDDPPIVYGSQGALCCSSLAAGGETDRDFLAYPAIRYVLRFYVLRFCHTALPFCCVPVVGILPLAAAVLGESATPLAPATSNQTVRMLQKPVG